jgi:sugar/nucleoside kinase (ribokinase family)
MPAGAGRYLPTCDGRFRAAGAAAEPRGGPWYKVGMAARRRWAVCLGHATCDLLGTLDGWPGPDEKTRLLAAFERQGGGPAATAAVTLARLGTPVRLLGVVGDDDLGAWILAGLRAEGVDVDGMLVRRARHSHLSVCLADRRSGGRNVLWHPGDAPDLRPAELPPGALDGAGVLLLDGRHPEAAASLAAAARRRGIPTLLDAGSPQPSTTALARRVEVCVASQPFARALAGDDRPGEQLRALLALGPRLAGVTLGRRGAVFGHAGDRHYLYQPALRVRTKDTTGAGDAFHGAVAWGLLHGASPARLLRTAAVVAALKCRDAGGRRGLPGWPAVRRRLAQPSTPRPVTLVYGSPRERTTWHS